MPKLAAGPELVAGNLAGATFRFHTDAPDVAAYARTHLAPLHARAAAAPSVDVRLRWHEAQPPRDRLAAYPHLAEMERVDRDLYVAPGELQWFRVDDMRDLFLRLRWHDDRLSVEGDFFHYASKSRSRDRIKRVVYRDRIDALRRRRFTTLLHYLVYYPCWWWLEHTRNLHPIHAAGVDTDRSVILLGGASGVGKSTLAIALATIPGARLLSDSFVLHDGAEVFPVREPILLDAWSRRWLGPQRDELKPIDWRYCLNRTGFQLPKDRLSDGGRAGLMLFPRRAPQPYVRRISAEQAHQRMSAADLIVNDLRRYWAFAASVEQMVPGGLVTRRQAQLAKLTTGVPCFEVGLTAAMTCAEAVDSILRLLPEQPRRVAGRDRNRTMIRVLFVEASSGGVVGGSLTGLYHLIHGLDRARFAPAMVLYESKAIEADLRQLEVPVYHVRRRRVPKEHALLKYDGYQRAKASSGLRGLLGLGRQALRLVVEELPAAMQLASVIRRARADVVHLGNGVRANFDGILACRLTRTPCVCHVKGFEKYSNRERRIARRIDALVCMTKAVEEHCSRNGVRGRHTQVVYDAVDEAAFAPQRDAASVRRELGISNGAPCLGVIGNIQEWKGQAVLVEAMRQVVEAVPEARGLIIGGVHRAGGAYNQQLETRIRELHLADCLSITGFRRDIADVMNALDVVVHTSVRPEPFGRVILEGMLLGKAVVATAAGGVPEMIQDGETGFLTAPGDAAQLAARLIPLLRDAQLRRQIGTRAQTWARQRFGVQQHVAEMATIYHNLTKGH